MKDKYYLMAVVVSLVIFAIMHKISKNKKPVKRAFLSMFTGLFSLVVVNLCGTFSGVTLPYSMLTIVVSAIGGVPGVTALLGLNLFF